MQAPPKLFRRGAHLLCALSLLAMSLFAQAGEVSDARIDRWIEAQVAGRDLALPSDLRARPARTSSRLELRYRREARAMATGRHETLVLLLDCVGELREGARFALDWVLDAPEIACARRADDGDVVASGDRERALRNVRKSLEEAVGRVATRSGPAGAAWLLDQACDEDLPLARRFRAQRALLAIEPREFAQTGSPEDFDPLFDRADDVDGLLLDWLGDVLGTFGARFFDRLAEKLSIPHPARRLKYLRVARGFTGQGLRLRSLLRVAWEAGTPEERLAAVEAAAVFTPANLPLCFDALSDEDVRVRAAAAEAIERSIALRVETSATDVLWREEGDPLGVRLESEETSFAWLARRAVPKLAELCEDPSERVRIAALRCLHELGADARPARDVVSNLAARETSSSIVRYWARATLGRIDSGAWATLRAARARRIELGEVPAEPTPEEARAWIARLRPDLAFPTEPRERESAEWSLRCAERWDAARFLVLNALPGLEEQAESGDLFARKVLDVLAVELDAQVRTALSREPGDAAGETQALLLELGPVMLDELGRLYLEVSTGDPSDDLRRDAARRWLAGLGLRALPYYVAGLEQWGDLRPECVMAIRRLGTPALPAAPAILAGWRWRGDDVHAPELEAFWFEEAPGAGRTSRAALDPEHNSYAGTALTRMGANVLPLLLEALDGRDARVRERACASLSNLDDLRDESLPALTRHLLDRSLFVRRAAALAILRLEPDAELEREARRTLAELGVR